MTLNSKFEGSFLFEIDFTPKGTRNRQTLYVYAKNPLDASNYLILNHIWGVRHSVRYHSSNLLNAKEKRS